MATLFKPTFTKLDPKSGRRVKKKLRKWYVRYRDAEGVLRTVPGYADKESTRQMAARLERSVAREKEGIVTPHDEQQKRPLPEHLGDFERYLRGRGNGDEYIRATCRQVKAVIEGCEFVRFSDIRESAVVAFLAGLRTSTSGPALDEGKEWFTAKEVAALLECRVESVHRLVDRGQLRCEGVRRKKKFARADVQTLLAHRHRGISAETSNHYLAAVKEFTRWLLRDKRVPTDPLFSLSSLNPDLDVRHARRALPETEFLKFVETTAEGEPFRGLSGSDRLVLYTLAANTGFRARELGSLTPANFNLDTTPPTATVRAAYSKHRRDDVQPLRLDVADMVRSYVSGKEPNEPLWPGTWTSAAAEMVRNDLAAAGIPYEDDDGRRFDFHAMRGQFISFLAARGVHPKVAQILARHSTITLTMDYYTHLDVLDVAGALNALPGVSTSKPNVANK